jgi:hypothetical protein
MGDSGVPTFNLFAGHLGNLTSSQEESLSVFKDTLAKAQLYDPVKPAYDDPTLLCVDPPVSVTDIQHLYM